ncbi:MAG TPA: sensor histidine kinase [Solirubrobacteraceae bacterium]|nr:sensor histidine kinase [Solirubrobacteraceae bacterium]
MKRLRDSWLLDGLIAVALATALELQLLLGDYAGGGLLDAAGGLLLTLPLAARRRAPLAVAGIFAATAALNAILGGGLFAGEPPPFASLVAGAVTFYSLGAHTEDRPALVGAGLGVAGLWSAVIATGPADAQSFLFSAGLIVATPWLVGRSMRSRSLRVALLHREQLQRERVAVGEERARIARELHDVVAHSVGVMVVQAQGARRVLDRDPERAGEALRSIEETGRSALTEMRRSLGVLREEGSGAALEPQPGIGDLDGLVEDARGAGLEIELRVAGEPRALPPGIDLSAYRIVQEALTNTIKHAGATHARIAVRYGERELELEVSDDGTGAATANGSHQGHGLVGMRERVALYGGELWTGSGSDAGYSVRARIPLET